MIDKYRFAGDRYYYFQEVSDKTLSPMSKKEAKKLISKNLKKIRKIQVRLYAQKKLSFLFVFQAMDAAGKDGTICKVFSGLNPKGVEVTSFTKPTEEEIQHDFLWRVHQNVPRKGMIGIFNRSHYEEVLVTRIHPEFILAQNLPGIDTVEDITGEFWENRYEKIRNFEKLLHDSGVVVTKFFLNVSYEEQERRLVSRIETPEKRWKFKVNDFKERLHWQKYMDCYQDMINATATSESPWYVIPADNKDVMRVLVSSKVLDVMQAYEKDIKFPEYEGNFSLDRARAMELLR